MAYFDDMKLAVETLTGGKNTVLYDDLGLPSIMVEWPKQNNKDIISGGTDQTHPGSIVNSVEKTMYIGKYQSIVMQNRAYSLPGQDPKTPVNFDTALSYCRNKGNGWCLVPYSLWAQVALWCRKNGTIPRGNNNYGSDHSYTHEVGRRTSTDGVDSAGKARTGRTATGSGPATWNHNWLPDGIADLNGNVWEWCAGMRLVSGQIQIIPNANVMDPEVSLLATSTAWKAIATDGSLVDTDSTEATLHYDYISSKLYLATSTSDTTDHGTGGLYAGMSLESGLTVPEIAKALILYPDEPNGDYASDYHWMNPTGERLPFCGGAWTSGASAGVFAVYLGNLRSSARGYIGFRSAFCEL